MQAILKSSLIVAGLAFAAAGSNAALARDNDHHGHHGGSDRQSDGQTSSGPAAPPAAYHQLHGNTQSQPTPNRHPAPPAAYHQLYGNNNHSAPPPVVQHDADRDHDSRHYVDRSHDRDHDSHHDVDRDHDSHRYVDRDHERDRDRDRDSRHYVDRDRDHDRDHHVIVRRDRDHDHDRYWDRDHRRYIDRDWFWARNWSYDWDDRYAVGWVRYDRDRFGFIPRHNHVFVGFGAQWMWWGGAYDPFDPPPAFRDCYPVIRYGYYHGRRARLGGTMCYRGGGSYLLPNSVFVITIF